MVVRPSAERLSAFFGPTASLPAALGRAIITVMQLMHFHTVRSGIQSNASPAGGPALLAMERTLRESLAAVGVFDTVEVEHTDDPDQLLVSLCRYHPNLTEDQVAEAVEQLWEARVRHPFWEAHSTRVDDGFVEFEGATRESPVGRYVTVHLVAERSPVPSQRGHVR